MITGKQARMIRENANIFRKKGTPNDMIIAKAADEVIDRCTVIDEN